MHKDKIPVYKAEAEDGLYEVITAKESCAILAHCPILLDNKVTSSVKSLHRDSLEQTTANNKEQFDLHYIYSILATTGWNKNDDVFDRQEMWGARATAEDKPFNKGHDPNNIIGHITGNAIVDEDYELVQNDSEFDLLPNKFHILTSAVIYKHVSSRDEDLTLKTKGLLQEIAEGEWYVSMEALFSNFDYALIDASGRSSVIARNEETAFLTKHLRSYGGAGEYNGNRVGRIMRNLTFSGKGLVDNPGNPESIIFRDEDVEIFEGVAEIHSDINLLVTSSSKGDSSMSDNNEQVRALESQVEKLETRLKGLDEEKVQAQISEFEAACAGKDAEITELESKIAEASDSSVAAQKSYDEISEAKEQSDKTIAELNEKLEAIEAQSLQTSRISALVDKGVDKAEAESLVETFAGITDEQFEALVSKLSEAAFPWDKDKDKDKDDKKKKKDKKDEDADAAGMKKKYAEKAETSETPKTSAEKAEETEVEAVAEEAAEAAEESEDAKVLDEAQAEEAPALAAQSEDESESVVASLNEYFSGVLGGKTNNESKS
jgi:hypothetical protein